MSCRGAAARDELIERYGVSKEKLVEVFGRTRDDWINNDFGGWLGANSYYDVSSATGSCSRPVFISELSWCGYFLFCLFAVVGMKALRYKYSFVHIRGNGVLNAAHEAALATGDVSFTSNLHR